MKILNLNTTLNPKTIGFEDDFPSTSTEDRGLLKRYDQFSKQFQRIPFSTVDMVIGILCIVIFCSMISPFQSEGRGGSTITTTIGPLANETSTFNPIGTFK